MIRILIVFLTIALNTALKAQNLDKMHESKRRDLLIKAAKEAVLDYGPDFYRDYGQPEIVRGVVGDSHWFTENQIRKYKNKTYYSVKYYYDKTQEYFPYGFSSWVFFFEDTGKPFQVYFGGGFGLSTSVVDELRKTSPNEAKGAIPSWKKQSPKKIDPPKRPRVDVEYKGKKKQEVLH